jgi:hypothetical protein
MILEALTGLSLVWTASLDTAPPPADPATWLQMSVYQRDAALLPLVQRATECILRQAARDPRYTRDMGSSDINDVIVDSITACQRPVRAMLDAHDRMYGYGSGEAFLLGPYLDVLPAAMVKHVKAKAPAH